MKMRAVSKCGYGCAPSTRVVSFRPPSSGHAQPRRKYTLTSANSLDKASKPLSTSNSEYVNVNGAKITNEELSSLNAFISESPVKDGQDLEGLIRKGSNREIQNLVELEGAMMYAEQVRLGKLSLDNIPPAPSLKDTPVWRPIFASSGGVPRLLYIPVPEYFDLSPDSDFINIITLLGPLVTHFSGTYTWKDGEALDYCISRLDFQFGKASFGFNLPGPLQLKNSLTFFFASEGVACARSKLGGTMLLVPQPEVVGMYPKPS